MSPIEGRLYRPGEDEPFETQTTQGKRPIVFQKDRTQPSAGVLFAKEDKINGIGELYLQTKLDPDDEEIKNVRIIRGSRTPEKIADFSDEYEYPEPIILENGEEVRLVFKYIDEVDA